MSSSERLLGAAVAALILFVLGVKLIPSRAVEPVAASRGSPSPTAQATVTPMATPSPTPPLVRGLGAIPMGPQTVTVHGVELHFDIPTPGWEQFDNLYISKSFTDLNAADAMIYWTPIEGDLARPCSSLLGPVDALSVEDQALALRGADGVDWDSSQQSGEGSIGGQPAGSIEVTAGERPGCGLGFYFDWQQTISGLDWHGPGSGDFMRVWITDLHGGRAFIAAITRADATETARPELDQIISSMTFQ